MRKVTHLEALDYGKPRPLENAADNVAPNEDIKRNHPLGEMPVASWRVV